MDNKWNDYKIDVSFDDDDGSEDVKKDIDLFEKSIIEYLKLFNQLPKKGSDISNGRCDTAVIDSIGFNGIDKRIFFWLRFE